MLEGILSPMNSICKINRRYIEMNEDADFGAPLTIGLT